MSKSEKILFAEDEKTIAEAFTMMFRRAGLEVTTVLNGKDVMKELEKNKYDLLLLDLVMPDMDGFDVLKDIQKKEIDIPVIVLTNLSQEEEKLKAEKLGAVGYYIKSEVVIADVIDRVREELDKRQTDVVL